MLRPQAALPGVGLAMERIWLFRDDVIRSGRYAKWAVAFASEFGVDVEVVGAVEVDVVVLRRGQVCRGLVGDREAFVGFVK